MQKVGRAINTRNVSCSYYHHFNSLQEFPLQSQVSRYECLSILSLSDYPGAHVFPCLFCLPACLWLRFLLGGPKPSVQKWHPLYCILPYNTLTHTVKANLNCLKIRAVQ